MSGDLRGYRGYKVKCRNSPGCARAQDMLPNLGLEDGYGMVHEKIIFGGEMRSVFLNIIAQTTCDIKIYKCHMYINIIIFCEDETHKQNI